MSVRSLCNNTMVVYSWTKASDAYGGWTRTSDVRYAAMPCRVQPISGVEQMRYGAERTVVTHKIFAPGDYTGLDHEDEGVCQDGNRYRFRFIRNPDRMDHHVEIEALELREDIR